MILFALLISFMNVAITVLVIKNNRDTLDQVQVHLEQCRMIREEISSMPLASVEIESLKRIDEHIAAIKHLISITGKHKEDDDRRETEHNIQN